MVESYLRNVAVCAFQPFNGQYDNRSLAAAGHHAVLRVPVDSKSMDSAVQQMVALRMRSFVVWFGQDGRPSNRECLRIETVARNIFEDDDRSHPAIHINPNMRLGATKRWSAPPNVRGALDRLHREGVVETSKNAGTFYCNQALWHICDNADHGQGAMFVHVPVNLSNAKARELGERLLMELDASFSI